MQRQTLVKLLCLAGLVVWLYAGGLTPVVGGPTVVVLAYESDDGPLPPYAIAAAEALRGQGRDVRLVDKDVVTGLDTVPAGIKPAIEAAKAVGLPALVVLARGSVSKAIKLPATKEAILEAAR